MTRIAPQSATPQEVKVRRPAPGAVLQSTRIVLTWSISRAAARACGLVSDETGPAVRLLVSAGAPTSGIQVVLEARVLDGERATVLGAPARGGRWIQDTIRDVWHLDIEGFLKLTVRWIDDSIEAMYARTELLANAGLAGGRYEFEGATLQHA